MKYALPHNAEFPLVEIDASVNQILNPYSLGTACSLAKHKYGVRTNWLIFFLFYILFRNRKNPLDNLQLYGEKVLTQILKPFLDVPFCRV